MKAAIDSMAPRRLAGRVGLRAALEILLDLTKARLTSLVLLSTLAGFYMGTTGALDYSLLTHCLVGTGLLASAAAALNQYWERDWDAGMRRTRNRPLPSGRLEPEGALWIGVLGAGMGVGYLAWRVNGPASGLGAVTLLVYIFIYTPLKRLTPLNTIVGAIPGALPPLMGWTAAQGKISQEGLALFALQFFWQLPHFLAIAWLYREDYARAGFAMLPAVDPLGRRTGRWAVNSVLGLLLASLVPYWLGLAGWRYALAALGCGLWFLGLARQFARDLTERQARGLFYGSLIYLPAVLLLMVLDKTVR